VLHHVSLEVRPGELERTVELFETIGFERVEAPEPIAEYVVWLEREATQVHLIQTPEPTVMPLGHPAFVARDHDAALAALRGAGFEVEESSELWGEPRAFATLPGGQKLEIMAAPPPPKS
jgi:catechol 2,3-dioxygenase-like lactoylglutathione lyase family enzyme